jgi:chromosome segregation protein
MRIQRLELIGFKSFPYETTIDFPEGITAIVGPNGCGKSNILDALMWVMGATSPKLLRSRSMEDVIFSGADEVAPLGRAEVRLLIDNSKGLACEPYRELPEIEIRRVVYRTGDSEFWLNKRRCRLRDITEFFLGTGLGTNSYAIIEQGKVDNIINAKPEERRLFLDESAGISKYKERREISIRKMEATKQNLSRVEDVLYEVNRQANRLKRQAAKARRYQRLKERLDTLKILRAVTQFRVLREKQGMLVSGLETFLRQVEAKQATWEALEAKINEAHTKMLEKEEALRTLNETYERQRDSLGRLQQTLFALQEQKGRLEESLKGLDETSGEMTRRRESLQAQALALQKEIGTLTEEIHEKERQLTERISVFETERKLLAEAESAFEAHKEAVFQAMTSEVDAKNRAVQLAERIDETKRGIISRGKSLSEASERLKASEDEKAALKRTIDTLTKDLFAKQAERSKLETALKDAEEAEESLKGQLRETEKQLSENSSSLTSLREIQQRMEDVSSKGAKVLLNQFFSQQSAVDVPYRLVADTIEIDPRYDRALEAILRDELEFVLVDDHDTALQSLSFLKEKNAGRSGLIPRNSLNTCEEPSKSSGKGIVPLLNHVRAPDKEQRVLSCLLKDVWVVKDTYQAVEVHKRNGFSGVLVTLDGDVFYPNGVIVGGSEEPGTGGRIARNRKIGELRKQIKSLEAKKATTAKKVENASEKTLSLRSRLEAASDAVKNLEMALVGHQLDLENIHRDTERIGKQIEILKSEIGELQSVLETAEDQREEFQNTYEEKRRQQESLRKDTKKFETKIQSLKQRVEAKTKAVNQLKIEEAKTKEKLQGLLEKAPQLEEEIEKLRVEIKQRHERIGEISEKLEEISGEIISLRNKIRESEGKIEAIQKEIEIKELNLRREKESILEIEGNKSRLLKELQEMKEEVSERKLSISQIEMEITSLLQEVKVHHNLDLKTEEPPVPEIEELEPIDDREITDLEEKLRQLGEINFVAVQEFDELRERMEFLEQQRTDLLEAIQILTETIQRINRTTTSRFKETFEKIQGYFAELFVKLFGGGRAEIRLTDPHNYQETGVEIFAQPPGKRLQVIRLLSGGEKALVSIAFLFALFLTRPSPFCVLDEVDAPLDESNIDRFNSLVKELSNLSQFILITHNKRTMACAQSLLGVTMEQPGISKIISVSLGDIPS